MQTITTLANGANSVYVADLDGDGDYGVLSASSNDDRIAWYENNGTGNFGNMQTITTGADGANSVYAADLDGDRPIIDLGGADAELFFIDSQTDQLRFKQAMDFEQPADANGDNLYEVEVTVTDSSGATDVQSLSINIRNENEGPYFTSYDGNASVLLSLPENSTSVTSVTAMDPDAGTNLTYSLHEVDSSKFSLNAETGVLSFAAAVDYENAEDNDTNNVYEVTVQVSDGELNATQAFSLSVSNCKTPTP